MITKDQISVFAQKFKANESTVYREYLQILFLQKLYKYEQSAHVFFKGGTAIHFLLNAPRFSEDLDFTVGLSENEFLSLIDRVFKDFTKIGKFSFKQRNTITGKRFLLTAEQDILPYATFINLDFSFREKVLAPSKSTFDTPYPVIFTSFIYHLSREELCAEKIRALLTREKGRDIFDLWYLISQGTVINETFVKEKMKYYQKSNFSHADLIQKVKIFSEKAFEADIRPFIPMDERSKLKERFEYIQTYLIEKLSAF